MRPRAVFTGLGLLTPVGLGVEPYWAALLAGRSGVKTIAGFDTGGLACRIGGQILDFDAKEYIDRKERKSLKVMARPIQLAVCATNVALADARIDTAKLDPTRFGVDFGAGQIPSELEELGPPAAASINGNAEIDLKKWGEHGLPAMPPLWLLKYLPNMLACHVSIMHNAQGPNNTITATDAAGLLAMGEAFRIIQRGQADVMLTGSADSKMNPLSMTRLTLFSHLSKRNDAPEKASRPFDRCRDGMVPGEGGGILVLEELEHARKRGGRIYAEMVGFGAAFDTRKDGDGLARAIQAALRQAGIAPDEVDHVNAQGFSTPVDDAWEARGIAKVFGQSVPVFAGKSYHGSLGAASGAVELAASILALRHGQVPGSLNYDEPDAACPVRIQTGRPRELRGDYAVKISLTEMGHCAVAVVRKWKE